MQFLFGILFALFVFPIVEGARDLVLTAIENLKSRLSILVYKNNQALHAPIENTHVIGFSIPTEEDWEDEDDD